VVVEDELDQLIDRAGRTHVIPPREDPVILDRLRDPRVFARAHELLNGRDEVWRHRAILCIERIGYVQRDQETAELLLQHAAKTKDRYEAMTTLEALKRCTPPQSLPGRPLLELARRKEWQVWLPAVECLHLAKAEEVESALLERLDANREALVSVARELRYMESRRSIEALEQLLEHENLDVRCVALDSLAERLGQEALRYARRLAARSFREQWWAEKWIARFGDASDVPFMAKRARLLVTGNRQRRYEPPELSYIFPFLSSHTDTAEARQALDLLQQRAERLPENERRWLETQHRNQSQG
jgi:HEAT repeat protein